MGLAMSGDLTPDPKSTELSYSGSEQPLLGRGFGQLMFISFTYLGNSTVLSYRFDSTLNFARRALQCVRMIHPEKQHFLGLV